MKISGHMIIRNEDQFVGFAIRSALPFLERLFIYDTGSTDQTVRVVREMGDSKIVFDEKGPQTPAGITALRNEMIAKTKTDWFFLLDGDEVWNQEILKKYFEFTLGQPKNILATYLQTRNCVGDIYHYRREDSGKYEIGDKRGHLNIRAYRKTVKWEGQYPLEHCVDTTDKNSLAFFDGFYWHMTHLKRSSASEKVLGFRNQIFDLGIKTRTEEMPEVFAGHGFPRRSKFYEIISAGAGLVRKLK